MVRGYAKEIVSRLSNRGVECSVWMVYRVQKGRASNPWIELEILKYRGEIEQVLEEVERYKTKLDGKECSKGAGQKPVHGG